MRSRPVIRIADDMTAILSCWRYGLRRSAVAKLLQLAVYTVKLVFNHKWDWLLWGYLGCLWSVERGCDE